MKKEATTAAGIRRARFIDLSPRSSGAWLFHHTPHASLLNLLDQDGWATMMSRLLVGEGPPEQVADRALPDVDGRLLASRLTALRNDIAARAVTWQQLLPNLWRVARGQAVPVREEPTAV